MGLALGFKLFKGFEVNLGLGLRFREEGMVVGRFKLLFGFEFVVLRNGGSSIWDKSMNMFFSGGFESWPSLLSYILIDN